jgi:hypothetical protein
MLRSLIRRVSVGLSDSVFLSTFGSTDLALSRYKVIWMSDTRESCNNRSVPDRHWGPAERPWGGWTGLNERISTELHAAMREAQRSARSEHNLLHCISSYNSNNLSVNINTQWIIIKDDESMTSYIIKEAQNKHSSYLSNTHSMLSRNSLFFSDIRVLLPKRVWTGAWRLKQGCPIGGSLCEGGSWVGSPSGPVEVSSTLNCICPLTCSVGSRRHREKETGWTLGGDGERGGRGWWMSSNWTVYAV